MQGRGQSSADGGKSGGITEILRIPRTSAVEKSVHLNYVCRRSCSSSLILHWFASAAAESFFQSVAG